MLLCFDSETTNLVQRGLPYDHPQQCRLVELGAILCEDDGTERASMSMIVRPDGWTIPPAATAVHGITQEVAERSGVEVLYVITAFACLLERADVAYAYNLPFDKDVLSIELLRLGEPRPVEWPDSVKLEDILDTVTPALNMAPTRRMKAAGITSPKKPKLSEAYSRLFDEELIGAHGAITDARAALRVLFKVKGWGELGRP